MIRRDLIFVRIRAPQVFRIAGQQHECAHNKGMGQKFEEIIGGAMMKNDTIVKIGVDLHNPNWRNVVDRKVVSVAN